MRLLGIVLLIVAVGILAMFIWPFIKPEVARGPVPESFSEARYQGVASNGAQQVVEQQNPPEQSKQVTGPLCDNLPEGRSARPLNIPQARVLKKGPQGGPWTWINLWAAWCKPCREEMPMLAEWARQLRGHPLKMVFLSVDDDERQLIKFMSDEGQRIVGEFQWLREERGRFYESIGVKDPPTLPVHVVLDPAGRIRCVRQGSVTGKELDEFSRTFGW